jgi:hypothetical protein
MMLRLSFGGAPCQLEWGSISKPVCNLINAILLGDNWDSKTLFAYQAQNHVPPKEILSNYIPFEIGRDLIINIPIDMRSTVDTYIDDFIGLTVNVKNSNNTAQLKQAPLG